MILHAAPETRFRLIGSSELGANTTTVTFASIPGGYKALWLLMKTRCTAAGAANSNLAVNFNNDVTGYDNQYIYSNAATLISGENINLTYVFGGYSTQNGAVADKFFTSQMLIVGYDDVNSDHDKSSLLMGGGFVSEATLGGFFLFSTDVWRDSEATAITEIDLALADASDFLAGSEFMLYGLL